MTDMNELSERVSLINVDGRDVYLVGTAHVSAESVEDVRDTIEKVSPDTICVELCKARHEALTQPDSWHKLDIFRIFKYFIYTWSYFRYSNKWTCLCWR